MELSKVAPTFDFTSHITERTLDFTGRQWVFAEIDRWLATPDGSRYFMITGEPGIGKTAIAGRLTQLYNLPAAHFCIAGQADTIVPLNFARALSLQLTRLDGFAQYITGDQGVNISGHAYAGQNSGPVIGVNINTLVVQAPSATVAFDRVVADPLRQLYAKGFDRQVVILVDALDEAVQLQGTETIVSLLAGQQHLPSQVRFIVTSRPESEVLRHFEQAHILSLNAENAENIQDVRTYVRTQVESSQALQARLIEYGVQLQTLIDSLVTASQGNFLYLFYLLPAIAAGTQRLNATDALPQGLGGFYRELLRSRIAKNTSTWRTIYRPILGILAAARAPLTEEQLGQFSRLSEQEVDDVLQDMQEFLDPTQATRGQYLLYHRSIAEFLRDKQQATKDFWIDLIPIHKSIVSYYREEAATWEEVKWGEKGGKDDYGLLYLLSHLYELRNIEAYRQDLYKLLCKSFMQAKYGQSGSHRPFAQDVAMAIEVATHEEPPNLVQEIRGSLIYATLGSMASNVPLEILKILIQNGQTTRALGFAELMQSAKERSQISYLIGEALLAQKDVDSARVVLGQALAAAQVIEEEQEKISALSGVAWLFVKAGRIDQLLEVVGLLKNKWWKAAILQEVALALVRDGQVDKAVTVIEQVKERIERARGLSGIIQALIQARQVDLAQALAAALPDEQLKALTLTSAARVLIEVGEKGQAKLIATQVLSLVVLMNNDEWKALIFSELAPVLTEVGEKESACAAAIQMRMLVKQVEDAEWKMYVLGGIARVMTQVGQFDQAMELVQAIGDSDAMAYILREIAHTLIQMGQFDQALELATKNPEMKTYIQQEMASILIHNGQIEQALNVIQTIEEMWRKADALIEIAQALLEPAGKACAEGIAVQLLEIAQPFATYWTGDETILAKITHALTLIIEFERLIALAQIIKGDRDLFLQNVVQALVKERQFDRALEAVEVIEVKWRKMDTLNSLITAMVQAEEKTQIADIERVLALVQTIEDEMYVTKFNERLKVRLEMVEANEGQCLKATILSKLAQVQARAGDKGSARAIATQAQVTTEAIKNQGEKAIALSKLVRAWAQIGEEERAQSVAVKAVELMTTPEAIDRNLTILARQTPFGPTARITVLQEVAQTLAEVGRVELALNLLAVDVIEDSEQKTNAQIAVAQTLARLGNAAGALRVILTIKNEKIQVNILTSTIEVLNQSGQFDEATTAAQYIKDASLKERIINNVLLARVSSLVQARRFEEALATGRTVKDEYLQSSALKEVFQTMVQAKLFDRVVTTVQTIKDEFLQGEVAYLLIQSGQFNQGLVVANAMKNKANTLRKIARALVRSGQASQAPTLVRTIEDEKWRATTLAYVAEALTENGHADAGLLITQVIENKRWKASALTEIGYILIKIGEKERATATAKEALDVAMTVEDEQQKAIALSEVAQLLVCAGEKKQAALIADEVLPLVAGLKQQVDKALVLSKLALCFVQVGQADQALATALKIEDESSRAAALSEVFQIQARAQDKVDVDGILTGVLEAVRGIESKSPKASALGSIALTILQVGKVDRALTVALMIEDGSNKADVLKKLFPALVQAGQVEQIERAMKAVEAIEDRGILEELLIEEPLKEMILTLLQAGQIRLALDSALAIGEGPGKVEVLIKMVPVLVQTGQLEQAVKAINSMKEDWTKAEVLKEVAPVLVQAGQTEQEMVLVETIEHDWYKEDVLREVALAQVEARQVNSIFTTIGAIKDEQKKVDVLKNVAMALMRAGQVDQSVESVLAIRDEQKKMDAWKDVARLLVQVRQVDQGLIKVQALENEINKSYMLRKVAQALAETGQVDRAVEIVHVIEDEEQKAVALNEVAQALIVAGKKEQVEAILRQVQLPLEKIKDERWKAYSQRDIAQTLAQAGQVKPALEMAQAIEDEQQKVNALKKIAQTLFQADEKEQAITIASQAIIAVQATQNTTWKVDVLIELVEILTQAEQQEQALRVLQTAFVAARQAGRESVFKALERGASTLGAVDQGQTLSQAYEAIQDVEGWWSIQ